VSVRVADGTVTTFFAPARINLIGEHIDYTQGRVLPASLVLGTRVTIEPRSEPALALHSTTLDERFIVPLPMASQCRRGHWSDYVSGVAWALEQLGIRLQGAQLQISSDVPLGAGLASSAALQVATALALLHRAGSELPARELALACQRAENDWVGAHCGPMDQLIALCGRPRQALLIDCASLESRGIALPADAAWILADTRVHHAHAGGEYNGRRWESEQLQELLRDRQGESRTLRGLSVAQASALSDSLSPTLARRLRHIVSENQRVLAAVEALERTDLAALGALLTASHASLRDDYEVSCPELDTLVQIACRQRGVYGARLHGGGFGGCALMLAAAEQASTISEAVQGEYASATGIEPWVHRCTIGGGARRLE
jgi:galactokinase